MHMLGLHTALLPCLAVHLDNLLSLLTRTPTPTDRSDLSLKLFEVNDATLYKETMDLKKINPALKVLISVGGW
jgi:hypothetical protein